MSEFVLSWILSILLAVSGGADVSHKLYQTYDSFKTLYSECVVQSAWVPDSRLGQILYGIEVEDVSDYENEVCDTIRGISSEFMSLYVDDTRRVWAAYNWVIDYFSYTYGVEGIFTHNSVMAHLERGTTNCGGYSGVFELLVLSMGIQCRVVNGEAGGWFHAWNEVYLDGAAYYLDPTWGASSGKYVWFLTDDPTFLNTHEEIDVYEWIERKR